MSKTLQLFSILPQRPGEFVDRIAAIGTTRWEEVFPKRAEYQHVDARAAFKELGIALHADCSEALGEPALAHIETRVTEAQAGLFAGAPFKAFHNGDCLLARCCYVAARALRPNSVIETGVCYGVTSAHLLQALALNGIGHLHSVDLPPLARNADDFVGRLIPEELRSRWTLYRGTARRRLRPLLEKLGRIDLFVHDSLHTYRNMRMEFEMVWPFLRPGGVLISDDVGGNTAWQELACLPAVACSFVVREQNKDSSFGVAVKRG